MNTGSKHTSCILCGNQHLEYEFMVQGNPLVRCRNCNFLFLNPPPETIDRDDYAEELSREAEFELLGTEIRRESAEKYFDYMKKYAPECGRKLLLVNCDDEIMYTVAANIGFDVTGLDESERTARKINKKLGRSCVVSGTPESSGLPPRSFDACVVPGSLQQCPDPVNRLKQLRKLLRPDGVFMITIPSLDSWTAVNMQQGWSEFKVENRLYFDRQTIQWALFRTGFRKIHTTPDKKIASRRYYRTVSKMNRLPLLKRIWAMIKALPGRKRYNLPDNGIIVISRAGTVRKRRLLSIVLPVYNERKTFPALMEELLPKKLPGIDKEIVIVESNSTDGTREEVLKYRDHDEVKVVLEDRPRGKGHAVRTGFEHAGGDFVLIQDGDLEYDLNDYELLVEQLSKGRAAFVLGSRHKKGWKIRRFHEYFLADTLNIVHVFLVFLVNLLYRQELTDPFTMYKVFRRDCLFGLKFECNRFDFDHELVYKLIRKGYTPHEVTVNYTARPFSEGKKVRFFADPPTWIKAIFKYRFTRVYYPFPGKTDK